MKNQESALIQREKKTKQKQNNQNRPRDDKDVGLAGRYLNFFSGKYVQGFKRKDGHEHAQIGNFSRNGNLNKNQIEKIQNRKIHYLKCTVDCIRLMENWNMRGVEHMCKCSPRKRREIGAEDYLKIQQLKDFQI